jgi:hypothetical protein
VDSLEVVVSPVLLVVSVDSAVVDESVEVVVVLTVVVSAAVVGSTGMVVPLELGVVVASVVDVLVLVDVVGAFVVCSTAVVPNASAPSSFAQPNGLSGPQLLLIPQPSDVMGARSRRTRANMTVPVTIAGVRASTQGFSAGAAASADVPWAVSGAG